MLHRRIVCLLTIVIAMGLPALRPCRVPG